MIPISIDLGNKNTVMAEVIGSNAMPIRDSSGNTKTSTGIFIAEDGGTSIGTLAMDKRLVDPSRFCDDFKIKLGTDQKCKIGNKEYLPEEVYALSIRAYLDRFCEDQGYDVRDVALFITVPVNLEIDTIQNIIKECEKCDLHINMKNILSESTAAAIHVSEKYKVNFTGKKLVIIDLGHGTLDIVKGTMAEFDDRSNPRFDIETSAGTRLGGRDLDAVMLQIIKPIVEETCNSSLDDMSAKDRSVINKMIRIMKEELSFQNTSCKVVKLTNHSNDDRVEVTLECTLGQYMDSAKEFIQTLSDKISPFNNSDVDHVIITGGPWATPFLKDLVKQMFGDKVLESDPYHTVVLGCETYGIEFIKNENKIPNLVVDTAPMAFSVTARNDDGDLRAFVHVPKGSQRPTRIVDTYRVPQNPSEELHTDIYTSNHDERVDFNPLDGVNLGRLSIPLNGAEAGSKVDVTIELLVDNRIYASAEINGKVVEVELEFK